MLRPSGREASQLRDVKIIPHYAKHAEGSVLVEFGDTKVLCNASVSESVPQFLRSTGKGWITAEYGMLPRSTGSRMRRESASGKQGGRTVDIQRLIARSLRAVVDLEKMPECQITVDCDVIQADGGTRTASITGACVALFDAFQVLIKRRKIKENPMSAMLAAISVGVYEGEVILDLDYLEDSRAETDVNVIMTSEDGFVEVQGTAEGKPFTPDELNKMLSVAKQGIDELLLIQQAALVG